MGLELGGSASAAQPYQSSTILYTCQILYPRVSNQRLCLLSCAWHRHCRPHTSRRARRSLRSSKDYHTVGSIPLQARGPDTTMKVSESDVHF